jgi:predicted enzyme involved in methoxymalonyl-ACP biosynthesis
MVEETMFYLAVTWAQERGAKALFATYLPTERNRPTLDVFRKARLKEESEGQFVWVCAEPFPRPQSVELHIDFELGQVK